MSAARLLAPSEIARFSMPYVIGAFLIVDGATVMGDEASVVPPSMVIKVPTVESAVGVVAVTL